MRLVATIILFFLTFAGLAAAEERIALVVGNAGYTAVAPLDNAGNDAVLMAASLESVGFQVTLVQDATQDDMKRAVATFGQRLRAAGEEAVGLFYYAGHGVQSFGANYLLPVDASLTVAADLDLVGLEAASVLRQMASARNRTNIVILDACRDNPFVDIPEMNDNGLAEMKAPTGTFLAYATSPGAVALDGAAGNSPFTEALVEAIAEEGLPIEQTFKKVRVAVLEKTGGAQTPWDTSSLTRDFTFTAGEVLTAEEIAEEQLWTSVRASGDPVQIMLFMRTYPDGRYLEDARLALADALAEELGTTRPGDVTEPVASMPAKKPVADRETALMEQAQASGEMADYRAYLEAFPDGVFAELVKIEIAALEAKASEDPIGPPDTEETEVAALPAPAPAAPEVTVLFDVPLTQGVPEIVGRTILEVAQGSPIFPPIEGLPDAMWKDQTCANCHQWTREALCDQGRFYQKEAAVRSLQKDHPFGGTFKRNLKHWADNDCR